MSETTRTGRRDQHAHHDRGVWTVPNGISVVRLACLPVFLVLLADDQHGWAITVLGVLGASDWIDGWVARRFDQVSEIGKILDPTADRILLITTAVALLVDGSVPLVVGVVVLARELIVGIAAVALAAAGARRIDVQWSGKAGTLALMFAFPVFLLAESTRAGVHDVALLIAWVFTVSGFVFGYHALVMYIPLARRAVREGRDARAARAAVGSGTS